MEKNIEVELRSFVDKEKYESLITFFDQNATLVFDDYQETYYFDTEKDLRIQKNDSYAKVWLKEGKIHDEARQELEIRFDRNEFEKIEELFLSLDYGVKIKWFRKRREYKWDNITVDMDFTKGYGYIIELEIMSTFEDKNKALSLLKEKLLELEITLTDRMVFEEKFKEYEANWEKLTVLDKV